MADERVELLGPEWEERKTRELLERGDRPV